MRAKIELREGGVALDAEGAAALGVAVGDEVLHVGR